jgi:hypothetical protein
LYNKAVLVQQRNKQDAKEQHDTAYMQVARWNGEKNKSRTKWNWIEL